jgi:hypothetical protein
VAIGTVPALHATNPLEVVRPTESPTTGMVARLTSVMGVLETCIGGCKVLDFGQVVSVLLEDVIGCHA